MFKKMYMPLFLSLNLAVSPSTIRAVNYDEADLHFMPKPDLIQLVKKQREAKDVAVFWATLKGIAYGSAATYAAFWFFKVNPQTAHKTLFKAINPF